MLAMRQIPAAYMGLNPIPASMADVIATGAPHPQQPPSRNEPNENAISKACNLLSLVMEAIKLFYYFKTAPLLTLTI